MFECVVVIVMLQQSLFDNFLDKLCGKCVVVGVGKVLVVMVVELENFWLDVVMQGVVVMCYEYSVFCCKIEIFEVGYFVLDDNSVIVVWCIFEVVQGFGLEDIVIVLIFGGGFVLMVVFVDGVMFVEKQLLNKKLLKFGVMIYEMNVVCQVFLLIKGGGLLWVVQLVQVVMLMILDVLGDDFVIIVFGLMVKVDNLWECVVVILKKYSIDLLVEIVEFEMGIGVNSDIRVIVIVCKVLEVVVIIVDENGYEFVMFGDMIEGEVLEMGWFMVVMVQMMDCESDVICFVVILFGGEMIVIIGFEGVGWGGCNIEFLLFFVIVLGDDNG